MICTGTSVRGSQDALALARSKPGVLYATAGVHPHDAARCDADTIDALRALAVRPEVVAIGECGLDFNRDFSPRPCRSSGSPPGRAGEGARAAAVPARARRGRCVF
jgi:TatD DNase family protein